MAKLLLIEDEELVRSVIREMLADRSWPVLEASTGREGIRIADEQQPDLLICDLILPDMDGGEVLAAVRRRNPAMPALMISGLPNPIPQTIAGLDRIQILHKPFSVDELTEAVDAALRG